MFQLFGTITYCDIRKTVSKKRHRIPTQTKPLPFKKSILGETPTARPTHSQSVAPLKFVLVLLCRLHLLEWIPIRWMGVIQYHATEYDS